MQREQGREQNPVTTLENSRKKLSPMQMFNYLKQIQCTLDIATGLRHRGWGRYRQRGHYICNARAPSSIGVEVAIDSAAATSKSKVAIFNWHCTAYCKHTYISEACHCSPLVTLRLIIFTFMEDIANNIFSQCVWVKQERDILTIPDSYHRNSAGINCKHLMVGNNMQAIISQEDSS